MRGLERKCQDIKIEMAINPLRLVFQKSTELLKSALPKNYFFLKAKLL